MAFNSGAYTAGAGVGGALIGLYGSRLSQKASRAESQRVRSWQEQLSNTAHQREIADLKAAGLNPMLSVRGQGSSTPTGSTAQIPDYGSNITKGISSGVQAAQATQTIRNAKYDADIKAPQAAAALDALKLYNFAKSEKTKKKSVDVLTKPFESAVDSVYENVLSKPTKKRKPRNSYENAKHWGTRRYMPVRDSKEGFKMAYDRKTKSVIRRSRIGKTYRGTGAGGSW